METPSNIRRSSSASNVYSPDLPVHSKLSRMNRESRSRITGEVLRSTAGVPEPANASDYSPILGEFSDYRRSTITSPLRCSGTRPRLSVNTQLANGVHGINFPVPGSPTVYSAANPSDFDLEFGEMEESKAAIPAPLNVSKEGTSGPRLNLQADAKISRAQGKDKASSGFDVNTSNEIEVPRRSSSTSSTSSARSNCSKSSGRSVKLTPLIVQVSHVDPAVMLVAQAAEICVASPLQSPTSLDSAPAIPDKNTLRYAKPSTLDKKLSLVGNLATRFEQAAKPGEPMRSDTRRAAGLRPILAPGVVAGLRKKFEFQ